MLIFEIEAIVIIITVVVIAGAIKENRIIKNTKGG